MYGVIVVGEIEEVLPLVVIVVGEIEEVLPLVVVGVSLQIDMMLLLNVLIYPLNFVSISSK